MKLIDLTVNNFLNEVDSNSPAPGGGSVSALASSLGVSLARMVAHLSFGKKKYEGNSEEIKVKFNNNFKELLEIKKELDSLIDRDTLAYNLVMDAFKLPKETEEEKRIRKNEIQNATKKAIETPYEITVLSKKAIMLLGTILEYGNQNAITDIAVGTLLLMTGLEGGILNVKVNLSSIDDKSYVENIEKELIEIHREAEKEKNRIIEVVNNLL